MIRRPALHATALLVGLTGCGPEAPREDASLALETRDPRFEIVVEGPLPGSAETARELRLRLLPKPGWHMAPDAPTSLELSAPPGVELDAPLQRGEDAAHRSEERIEFALVYRLSFEPAAGSKAYADGRLTFGVCRDGKLRCEIVRRELEIPLTPRR